MTAEAIESAYRGYTDAFAALVKWISEEHPAESPLALYAIAANWLMLAGPDAIFGIFFAPAPDGGARTSQPFQYTAGTLDYAVMDAMAAEWVHAPQ